MPWARLHYEVSFYLLPIGNDLSLRFLLFPCETDVQLYICTDESCTVVHTSNNCLAEGRVSVILLSPFSVRLKRSLLPMVTNCLTRHYETLFLSLFHALLLYQKIVWVCLLLFTCVMHFALN